MATTRTRSNSEDRMEGQEAEPVTPLTDSGRTSPASCAPETQNDATSSRNRKKKKKKKVKKPEHPSEASTSQTTSVLRISRNKHWKYISSYNGDWPNLQIEAMEDLYALHYDPQTVEIAQTLVRLHNGPLKRRSPGTSGFNGLTPPDSPLQVSSSLPAFVQLPSILHKPFPAAPPAVSHQIFQTLIRVRRLVDEASELSVRASSGLSSVEIGNLPPAGGVYGGIWGAHAYGVSPMSRQSHAGRNPTMSANRIHRLRSLAVHKLAQAYKADEIASSVMIMQGGDVFDDIAERVLKVNPNDVDARYVHFFHEKIPSRHLSQTTTTDILDQLVAAHPDRLEYYRTRGIVQCFREEYPEALKDFTYALKELRAQRRTNSKVARLERSMVKKSNQINARKPPKQSVDNVLHESKPSNVALPSPEEDFIDFLEPQVLFFRGITYLLQAISLVDAEILRLENIDKKLLVDGQDLRLSALPKSKYGGVEVGNLDGPLGNPHAAKRQAYTSVLGDLSFKDHIFSLVKKSMRDHEKFIGHFDSVENPDAPSLSDHPGDIPKQTQEALRLSDLYREKRPVELVSARTEPVSVATTYHPLLVESQFAILLCYLMLGNFTAIVPAFIRTANIINGLDPSPIFAPARSVTQAEFTEVLERLARSWRNGIRPHSQLAQRGKTRINVERPILRSLPSSSALPSPPVSRSNSYHDTDNEHGASSSSSKRGKNHDHQSSSSALSIVEEPKMQQTLDTSQSLDSARILLSAVLKQQRCRAEAASRTRSTQGGKTSAPPLNLPLHGPRVDVILAWLAAVHLPEFDEE